MDLKIYPSKLSGSIAAIPSKSQAHRLLICAAFSHRETVIECPETNQDITATVECLAAIGADIERTPSGYLVKPIRQIPQKSNIDCCESGSTLRFLLPIVCALGIETTIHMSGRLPHRPLSPLWEELERNGCVLTRPTVNTIHTSGKLTCGDYSIAGDVSSQFITGLLIALALLDGTSNIHIIGKLESRPYVEMTRNVLRNFGIDTLDFTVHGCAPFRSPGTARVEGDWSNAAFFLAAAGLGHEVCVQNLDIHSHQGDRVIAEIIRDSCICPVISAADIPDLVPILAVYFAAKGGAVFTDVGRLRLKESDRVQSVTSLLQALGIGVVSDANTMTVRPGIMTAGTVDACGDHRIAMAAGIAATVASGPVIILGAECVAKSYPAFWQEFRRLGGKYEQYIR